MGEQPLSGVRVAEFTKGVTGAACGKVLADLGADVVKIEPPHGDPARRFGPFPGSQPHPEKSGRFLYLNAGKRGVTLDVDSTVQRERLYSLLQSADVFVTDLEPARLVDFGLDYTRLQERNDRLVVTCVSFFGQTGPYRDFKGTDLIAWHVGGLGYETPAHAVTNPETQPPLRLAGEQASYLSAWVAATGTALALMHRDRTGKGQLVDVSSMESIANIVRGSLILHPYDVSRVPRIRRKSGFSASAMFQCKDGYISISLSQAHWWESLTTASGAPPELRSPKYAEPPGRRAHADALEDLITSWFMKHTRAELFEMLNALRIPVFPLNSLREVTASAQYAARQFFVEQDHPVAGTVRHPGPVLRLAGVPRAPCRAAPTLGRHNGEVFDSPWGSPRPAVPSSPATSSGGLPLEGVRVLDFGWFYAAPHAGAWLGALGAEVIRVESAARVEFNRLGANAVADGISGINRSAIWNGVNFSKLGITLNLSTDRGKEIARDLAAKSDVVIENFSAGVMDRLGLGYQALKKVNPGIILLSCSALGSFGPETRVSGLGPNIQVYAGLPFISGYRNGPPALGGGSWPDFVAGTIATLGIVVALRDRRRTGEGQAIDLSMAEVITSMIPEAVMDYFMNGVEPARDGNHDPSMSPHAVYPCQGHDQWAAIAVADDEQWRSMCHVMGRPECAEDSRFRDLDSRKTNEDELDQLVSEWTRRNSPYTVMRLLQAAGVAAAPVMSVFDLVANRHLKERGYFVDIDHPEVGPRSTPGLPVKLSAIPKFNYFPAPQLGQHNELVFKGILGMDAATYDQLVREQVIF